MVPPISFPRESSMRKSHNGAAVLKHTSSACVDLFSFIGAARKHPAGVLRAFERAYREDASLATRILLWARDARGGAGERTVFRNILHWLEKRHPHAAHALVSSGTVQTVGRWDDMLHLQSDIVWPAVVQQVVGALNDKDRLVAKWLPRSGPIAARFCRILGCRERDWRKTLASLSDTVEQRICAKDWAGIDFSKVPSVANARLMHTFRRHAGFRLAEHLESVVRGETKMNASAVYPHDVLKSAQKDDAGATVQWSQLHRPILAGSALVVSDVSGSMATAQVSGSTTAMDVCVALSLLLTENLPEPFRNQVITFTDEPSWHVVEGESLAARAECLRGAKWGMNTDLQAVFRLILARASNAQAAGVQFEMPKVLLILSDMEFDEAERRGRTNHEAFQRKFEAAGLKAPQVVYWNLNGRPGNVPAGNQPGVALVSGYSPRIAEVVLSGQFDEISPEAIMRAAVEVPRYDIPGITTCKKEEVLCSNA